MEVNDAIKLIEEEKAARVERCKQKINDALAAEQCIIDVKMIISVRGAEPVINILPKG
jgi:hypothetical protein